MTGNPVLFSIMIVLAVLALAIIHVYRLKIINAISAQAGFAKPALLELKYQPVIEIAVCFILTFACLYFSTIVFQGTMVLAIAFTIAFLTAAAASFGAYRRYARRYGELTAGIQDSGRLPVRLHLLHCLAQFLLTASVVFLIGLYIS